MVDLGYCPPFGKRPERPCERICPADGFGENEPRLSRIRSSRSRFMCVSDCLMIRMCGRRRCSTRWWLWAMSRAIRRSCGRSAIGVFDRRVALVRVPGVVLLRLLIIHRVRSVSGTGWSFRIPRWGSRALVLVGVLSHSGRFRAWVTSSQDQPHLGGGYRRGVATPGWYCPEVAG